MNTSPGRRRFLAGAGLLAAGALAGCTDRLAPEPDGGPDVPGVGVVSAGVERETSDVPEATVGALARDNAAFALDLHGQLVAAADGPNLLASPYSVSVALAMTYAGARALTAEQMAETLHFDVEALHPAFNALDRRVDPPATDTPTATATSTEDDGIPFRLDTVNAVWGQAEFPWREAYLETLSRHYGAGLHTVDFASDHEAARERINEWVAARTEGEIEELFPPDSLDHLTRMVLTNAVYFRANWAIQFDEKETEPAPFTALDGSTSEVPMMRLEGFELPYTDLGDAQAVELPYVGGDVGMVVLVPPAGAFESFERNLDAEGLFAAFEALESTEGTLRFPKFGFESGFALPDRLKALGMRVPFDPNRANFRDMYRYDEVDRDLYLGDIRHRTAIEVDERGTEAAAATGVEVRLESAAKNPFELTVDRPFIFCIRHRPTNAVLFLGRVGDAAAARP